MQCQCALSGKANVIQVYRETVISRCNADLSEHQKQSDLSASSKLLSCSSHVCQLMSGYTSQKTSTPVHTQDRSPTCIHTQDGTDSADTICSHTIVHVDGQICCNSIQTLIGAAWTIHHPSQGTKAYMGSIADPSNSQYPPSLCNGCKDPWLNLHPDAASRTQCELQLSCQLPAITVIVSGCTKCVSSWWHHEVPLHLKVQFLQQLDEA